ncbi:unnamed protein product [Trichogramma brassicae]|uniref:Endonuclease/exonuclease/phosphatase domain-containing protein n=1 Tax=Trichogramma brassicae TaxID=86971 RepID=A0A6H5IP29_9HYME|nr:unnamed protein product [Trichogramma brassicae]
MATAMNDGLQSPQGQTSVEKSDVPSLAERVPIPLTRTSPSTIVKAISEKIIVAPLHCKEKDFKLPSVAEFATGTMEDKLERMDGLIRGLGQFIKNKSNLHKEVTSYRLSLGMALEALVKSLGSQVPPRPPAADKAVCTSPLFTGSAMSKRPADSSPEMRVPSKRSAGVAGPSLSDENNNVAEDCDDYVLVDKRRRQRRKPQLQLPPNVSVTLPAQPLKPRPARRRVHHRPDAIIIKANDASTYAEILKKLKREPALQQTVGSSSLRKAYAGTQVAVVALPDELAAAALKLGHVRIGWVNCRIRAREEAARCYRCWRALATWPLAARVPTARISATDAARRAIKQGTAKANLRAFSAENEELTTIVTRPQARAALWPRRSPGPPMMRILQLNLNHCEAAQDLLCDAISKLRIDVAILCEQYKKPCSTEHMARRCRRPSSYLGAWWNSGAGAPSASTSLLRVGPNRRNFFFFSVYAPPRLSEREFSALLANITEEARGRRPLVIAGDFNAWSTE